MLNSKRFFILFLGVVCQFSFGLSLEEVVKEREAVKQEIQEAILENVHFLAPNTYGNAKDLFKEANESDKSAEDIAKALKRCRETLQEAQKLAKITEAALPNSYQGLMLAARAGANDKTEGYKDAKERFITLAQSVENGDLNWAKKYDGEVQRLLKEAELQAITDKAVRPAMAWVKKAEENDADDLLPVTFEGLKKKLEKFESEIRANPYQSEQIAKQSKELEYEARQLNSMVKDAKLFSEQSVEQNILWLNSKNTTLAEKVLPFPIGDQPLDKQYQTLNKKLSSLVNSVKGEEAAKVSMKKEISSLSAENQRISQQAQTFKRDTVYLENLARVRALLEPDGVKVFDSKDGIILRLEGLKFSVGKAEINSSDYPLLSKVASALESLPKDSIVIEGNTDAMGGRKKNEALSLARAKAVQKYLSANSEELEDSLFKTVGQGENHPIATNNTREGRQLNRRVDILVVHSRKTASAKPVSSGT